MSFKEITPQQAWEMVQQGAVLADIRHDAALLTRILKVLFI